MAASELPDLVAMYITQQTLTAEATHRLEAHQGLAQRVLDIEKGLLGPEGLYTQIALMTQQHQRQEELLTRLSDRAWHLILAVVGEALLLLGLFAWQGLSGHWRMPPASPPVPPIVVPYKEIR